jgi:hypothetical protein
MLFGATKNDRRVWGQRPGQPGNSIIRPVLSTRKAKKADKRTNISEKNSKYLCNRRQLENKAPARNTKYA